MTGGGESAAGADREAAQSDPEPLVTTVRMPRYLAENVRRWLHGNPAHSQASMIFAGLAELGVAVRPEDLVPKRRPGAARHR